MRKSTSPWPPGHEKAPDTDLNPVLVEGIELRSRYGKSHELSLMRVMVFDLTPEERKKIRSISCDSQATYCFLVKLRKWDEEEAKNIAHTLEGALFRFHGGHNGIVVEIEGHHFTIRGIWLEDNDSDKAYDVLKKLRETFPAVFDPEKPVPLKVGIDADILKRFPRFSLPNLKIALSMHTRSVAYLSMMVEGHARRNLRGEKSGEVTALQAETARRMLGVGE